MHKKHPNIIVVICHDLGQHLGCYGVPDVRSPNIDEFAESGVRFDNSFCTAPQCSPSRAALWTGRFPHANGVVGLTHGGFANDFNPGEQHFAEILSNAGYETHLFGEQHERPVAKSYSGYEYNHGIKPCGELAADFAGLIAEREKTAPPLFVHLGFTETHRPFTHGGIEVLPYDQLTVPGYLPDIPEVREDLADIEACIVSVDRAFARIVASIRSSSMAGNTIIMFTADHGIAFPHSKMTLYDPGIEVPLILAGPGIQGETVRYEMISNVDVMPTLLDLAEIPHPSNLQGRSFSGLLKQGEYTPSELIFAEKTYHTYYDPMRAVRSKRWKLIANFECAPYQEMPPPNDQVNAKGYVEIAKVLNIPRNLFYHPPFELFDLENDPYEQHNLADDPNCRSIRDNLVCSLRKWMKDTGDPLLNGPMAQGAYRRRMKEFKRIGKPTDERDDRQHT
ncbi:MAG: sulfatase [Candidatus Omnitrophica bacterium]|nr:sulfatase [Candidatus Omnitrophota bacterium]